MSSKKPYMKTKLIHTLVAISLFATALPIFAQTATPTPSQTPGPSRTPAPTNVNLVCMQSAVGKRDGAIVSAFDTFYNAAKSALTARMSALKAAWGMTDKKARQDAQRKAWSDYRSAVKDARKTFRNAQKTAWKQFDTDAKECHGTDEFNSRGADEQL